MGKGLEKFQNEMKAKIDGCKDEKERNYLAASFRQLFKHMREVCDEEYDNMLAQEHKSFERAWQFIRNRAQKAAVNGVAFVADDDVYAWLDEYVGKDDKEEFEKEKRRKEEAKKAAAERKQYTPVAPAPKPKKEDNQLTLFDNI